ncbi:MAG: type II methionyl aminopeptidase [Candidatus Diapherotrites archaeon]|nr:type II methionyl aminopeptidase [Candidatus Diapherotrites archaeon]MDZ4256435.1 type II methionyl aminopeptidase [archaeon]
MDPLIVAHYETAAKVHALCRQKARDMIQPGVKLLDIAEEIEALTKKNGCGIAFPINLSLNDIAAHYTPSAGDETLVKKGDVLKVDIGVHHDGYIVDAAFTLDFSGDAEVANLVTATQAALEAGFKEVKMGVEVRVLGAAIGGTLKKYGVDPILNLSGHGLDAYTAHCSPTIPNIANDDPSPIEEGHAYAMEPFASIRGNGEIFEAPQIEIFEVHEKVPVRNPHARRMVDFCLEHYEGLPFAERWLARDLDMSDFSRKTALRDLVKFGAITPHPVLREKKGAIVAQFETTMLINQDSVKRLV